MILDSNIIIYAAKPEYAALRQFIREGHHAVSAISWVECFGYHGLTVEEDIRLRAFFDRAEIFDISMAIISLAADLRRQYRLDFGDSIIAATSIRFDLTLATHNTADFEGIEDLVVYDPLAP